MACKVSVVGGKIGIREEIVFPVEGDKTEMRQGRQSFCRCLDVRGYLRVSTLIVTGTVWDVDDVTVSSRLGSGCEETTIDAEGSKEGKRVASFGT